MKIKILELKDLSLFSDFVDDEDTKYNIEDLTKFINENNNYGFILQLNDKLIGFAYGFMHLSPNGKKSFYLDSIDIMKEYQNNGYGSKLIEFIKEFAKENNCFEMYLISNKNNKSACKCYEKSKGFINSNDDVLYIFNLEK